MEQQNGDSTAADSKPANDPGAQGAQAPEQAAGPQQDAAPEAGTEDAAAAPSADQARVAELEEEVAALKDQLLRAVAETDNIRKRSQKEIQDAHKYATADFAKDMLGVSDNMRRALESVPQAALERDEHLKALAKGVELTEKGLMTVIERHGILPINPLGQKFDPNLHQAMFQVEDPSKPQGTVAQVVQAGYMIHDRLLRPAMVGVVKASEAPPVDAGPAQAPPTPPAQGAAAQPETAQPEAKPEAPQPEPEPQPAASGQSGEEPAKDSPGGT